MSSKMQKPYLHKTCITCKIGKYKEPSNGQEWHLVCDACEAILFCYEPMEHQARFHEDSTKYRGFFGGYGSAKTTTGAAEIIRHILETPRGRTLIGAQTVPQLEQTAMKEFFEMFPEELVEDYFKQQKILITTNGHEILFRPLDDEGKIRSLNLTAFWIEEASEVKYDIFVQLQNRLRNNSTDHHIGILTSNPDLGWIKTDFLLLAKSIFNAEEDYVQEQDKINPEYSVHIAPTYLNIHLPPGFYESNARNKPEWWIRRYLNGSFAHTEGQVYPMFYDHLVDPFPIPKDWEKGQASDFGLRDPTASLWGAIDPETGIVYLYDEHYEAGKSVKYHAGKMNERLDQIPNGRLRFLVGDPKGKTKSEKDLRSIFDHYQEYGIYFQPASNKILYGIMKVYTYFEMGKLKIFKSLTNTIREGVNYKYKPQDLVSEKNPDETPIDKDNHLMDCLRYFVAELPDDPTDLINPSYGSQKIILANQSQTHLPYALQDDEQDTGVDWLSYY